MKRLAFKFLIGFAALTFGLGAVWIKIIVPFVSSPVSDTSITRVQDANLRSVSTDSNNPGAVVIRFRGFEPAKDWIANFEIAMRLGDQSHMSVFAEATDLISVQWRGNEIENLRN